MKDFAQILMDYQQTTPQIRVTPSKTDIMIGNLFQSIFVLYAPNQEMFLLCNPSGAIISSSPGGKSLVGLTISMDELHSLLDKWDIHITSDTFDGEYPFTVVGIGHAPEADLLQRLKTIGNALLPLSEFQVRYLKRVDFVFRAFDAIEDYAFTVIDENAIIRFANKTNADILKIDNSLLQNFIEKEMDVLDKSSSILYRVLKTGEKENQNDHVYMLEGKPIHQKNIAYPIRNDAGQVIGSVDIFTGIESQKSGKRAPKESSWDRVSMPILVGKAPQMLEIVEMAKGFAMHSHCVLILGESGTGKEMIAQYIHSAGARATLPFVTLNCANLMDTLIDSELFGYEEGAYTGSAKGGKKGKFELAHGGTLFLDEIGELPLHLQSKLLRAIETKKINKLGSEETISVNVRIIAATNRSLAKMVKQGTFREDLFYRLNVLSMEIPPLRDRKSDIPIFVRHFIEKYGVPTGRSETLYELLVSEIEQYLSDYAWPGNIRELENLIIRFIVMSEKKSAHINELLSLGQIGTEEPPQPSILRRESYISKEELMRILTQCNGNKREAAKRLGVGRSTLYRYFDKYGL